MREREREKETEREIDIKKKERKLFSLNDRECSAKPWPARVSAYVDKSVFVNRES